MSTIETVAISSISGGIISIIVNIASYYIKKGDKKKENQKQWYQQVNSLLRDLRIAAIKIEGDKDLEEAREHSNQDGTINEIDEYLNQIEDLNSGHVPEGVDSDTRSSLRKLVGRVKNPTGGPDNLQTTTDLSDYIYEKSSGIEDSISKKLESY
jgi:hypothetical protein